MQHKREPLFRGPWPVWTTAGLILAAYAAQSATMDITTAARAFGLTPTELAAGNWGGVITDLFVHGAWAHAIMNAVGALAFGAPVARFFGLGPRGAAGFFLLYFACGVLSNLGYAALHLHDSMPLVGASGAVSGLLGAAVRLMEHRPGISPLASRTVAASTMGWVVINLAMGLLHYAPGIGEVQVAWEAHLAGYFAGLLLIAPADVLFREPVTEPEPGPWSLDERED